MAIQELVAGNFKGINSDKKFKISPITIFVGANSSGKSSCVHALTVLAQTIKLGDRSRPIVLDDENAQVHLGRFIEVIHTKTYKDSIHLGVGLGNLAQPIIADLEEKKREEVAPKGAVVTAEYWFKSTLKTQAIQIQKARFTVGQHEIVIIPNADSKSPVIHNGNPVPAAISLGVGFALSLLPTGSFSREFLVAWLIMNEVQRLQNAELRRCFYLGPFRETPRRRYQNFGGFPIEVGGMGENSVTLMGNEYLKSKNRPHITQIGQWLDDMGLARAVNLKRVGTSDLFEVALTLKDNKQLPISDLGYGISQVLPVLAQCSFAPPQSTLLFEQPEIHLHPGSARKLAQVFVETATQKKCNLILETHSIELIHELMDCIKSGLIKDSDISLYEVKRENSQSEFRAINVVLEDGEVEVDLPWFKTLQ